MIRFPLIDLIENGLNWARRTGSIIFWIWVFVVDVPIAIGIFSFIEHQDFETAKRLIGFGAIIGLGGWFPISKHEKQWLKNKNTKNNEA